MSERDTKLPTALAEPEVEALAPVAPVRAVGLCREHCPDAVGGLYSVEELA